MKAKDLENKTLVETLENREAGVQDLMKFYDHVEAIYAASARALRAEYTATASSTTNRER